MPQEVLTYSATVSDDTGNGPSRMSDLDGAYFLMETIGHTAIIELTNLTGNVGTINWIQHTIHGNGIAGKTTATGTVFLANGSNATYFSEAHVFNPPGIQTKTGTQRTTSNGTDAWTESQINDLRLKIQFVAESHTNDLSIDFVKVTVDYDEPAAAPPPTYDTSANNTHITSGNIHITSGNIFI